MATVTENSIIISIPFAIPAIGLTQPTTISLNKNVVQTIIRIIVAICAAIIFWPKIAPAFGFGGQRDVEAERDIQERIAKMESERDVRTEGQKKVAVVNGTTTVVKDSTETPSTTKRRKA